MTSSASLTLVMGGSAGDGRDCKGGRVNIHHLKDKDFCFVKMVRNLMAFSLISLLLFLTAITFFPLLMSNSKHC